METITIIIATALLTTIGAFIIFRYKSNSGARKRLDDLLIDLENELFMSTERQMIFRRKYPEIRKAATDFERWMICPFRKARLRRALRQFRGDDISDEDIHKLQGGPNEPAIDILLTSKEVRCIAPHQSDFEGYVTRIAELRKVTGSRKWEKPTKTTI